MEFRNFWRKTMIRFLIAGILLSSISCSLDRGVDCVTASDRSNGFTSKSSPEFVNQELILEYVDADGTNLFQNGTYDPDEVTLQYNGQIFRDVVDQTNEETKNSIHLNTYSEGRNLFHVSLRPTDSKIDVVTVYATVVDFSPCTGPTFAIDSAFVDAKKHSINNVSDWLLKLTITKH